MKNGINKVSYKIEIHFLLHLRIWITILFNDSSIPRRFAGSKNSQLTHKEMFGVCEPLEMLTLCCSEWEEGVWYDIVYFILNIYTILYNELKICAYRSSAIFLQDQSTRGVHFRPLELYVFGSCIIHNTVIPLVQLLFIDFWK